VASRKVMAFRLSNTLTVDFCVEALEEAISKFGVPELPDYPPRCSTHCVGLGLRM
jgi:hypothetical protein